MSATVFTLPVRVLLAGSSQSGKTTFIRDLLMNKDKYFDQEVKKVVYCSKFKNSVPEELNKICEIHIGLPTEELIDALIETSEHSIIIVDDLSNEACMSKLILSLFTCGRHNRISIILVLHNLFNKEK